MVNLKNLARRKARQAMHNSEDARVTEATSSQKPKKGRMAWIKAKAVSLLKLIARIRFYIWLWEKAAEGWDYFNTVVIPFVENIL
ncbi:hypothetical protein BK643_05880 [Pseudomonas protegens]|uniref:hypothetical protein n=1 Tax=Pseudomonas protegens TaxID=380021 RepID=UPI000F47D53D|nr:hypothetical protein [Pseudomonas protegens]ROM18407.1 hypothetical protein BK643_05880 [Pseudomonas protegens]